MFENQLKSVIQWVDPDQNLLFEQFTAEGDEIKNASKLIIGPGQGCLYLHEGRIEGIFEEEGVFNLNSDNIPFLTTIKSYLSLYKQGESKHKTGIWFYKRNDILNKRWGTRSPIMYNDPVYNFPVGLRAFGNYSFRIFEAMYFFTSVVGTQEKYTIEDIQEVFVSRIVQPITDFLANAKFSYAEVDSKVNEIAKHAKEESQGIFYDLGFSLLDFRIEGTSFDEATQERIGRISDVSADVQAAKLAGLDYAQMEQLKMLREAAKNESGAAGAAIQLGAGMQLGSQIANNQNQSNTSSDNEDDSMARLKKLKQMFEMELITEEEYNQKKQEILKDL